MVNLTHSTQGVYQYFRGFSSRCRIALGHTKCCLCGVQEVSASRHRIVDMVRNSTINRIIPDMYRIVIVTLDLSR